LADQGELDQAILKLKGLLIRIKKGDINQLKLNYDLANLLFMQGRYREAEKTYQKVVELSEEDQDLVKRAQARVEKMKEREAKKRDKIAIRIIDIETVMEEGDAPPEGAREFLAGIGAETIHFERAQILITKIQEGRKKQVRERLDRARELFDKKRKYKKVLDILESIQRDYSETVEMPSILILKDETEKRLGRRKKKAP
jgi:tetratricopeptide (TPR) repeat protein